MSLSPAALRALLPTTPAPDMPGVRTGIAEIDRALASGGLPRGRLTEVVGARGSGKTTLLRQIVESTVEQAGWIAYIDATRTLAPRDWAHLGVHEGVWMVRPTDATRAAWCADVLLRCGAFSLVVIDSAPPLTRAIAVRLTRLARESSAALVVVKDDDHDSMLLSGAVRLRVKRVRGARNAVSRAGARAGTQSLLPAPPPPWEKGSSEGGGGRGGGGGGGEKTERSVRQLSVVIEKGGTHQVVEVRCAIGVARRLCAHPQVPDRRGVAKRATGRSGSERRAAPAALPNDGTAGAVVADGELHEPGTKLLARKRRCAEPDYGTVRERRAQRA
jgi:RecA DNA recombination protein